MSSTAPSLDPALRHSPLVRAARREDVSHTPVWFMRQAGRSLPEYRKVREGIAMLDSCRDPDLVTEITLQPVRRHGVDAAIFFSDIVVPLAAVGVDLDIVPGVGPVVAEPVRTRADLDRLPELTPEHVPDITRAVQQLTRELGGTPLIGFAGAPFTLASYLIEGGPSKNHEHTKALMYGDPQLWHDLCARLAQISGAFLRVQASAGASARAAVRLVGRRAAAGGLRARSSSRTPPRRSPRSPTWTCPASTSAWAPASCSRPWARPGPRSSASTTASRSPTASRASGPTTPSRATSTRPCCSRRGTCWRPRCAPILDEGRAAPGHIFNLGHGVLPRHRPRRADARRRAASTRRPAAPPDRTRPRDAAVPLSRSTTW